jgi:glycosyltransferase involved in cell wall biosynthesis
MEKDHLQRVVMLVTNDVFQDSRVKKEAKSLSRAGWDVQIFGLSSRVSQSESVSIDGLNVTLIPAGSPNKKTARSKARTEESVSIDGLNVKLIPAGSRNKKTARSKARTEDTIRVWASTGYVRFATRRVRVWAKKVQIFLYRAFFGSRLYRLDMARKFRKQLFAHWDFHGATVVHCHDFDTLFAGYKIAKRSGAVLVYDSHELWSEMNVSGGNTVGSRTIRAVQLRQERKLIRKCDGVISVSDSIASRLSEISSKKIPSPIVVRNIPNVSSTPEDSMVRNVEHNTIFYSGRITSGRALSELIESFDHESMSTFGIRLLGYGSPPFVQATIRMAREREVELEVLAPVPGHLVSQRLEAAEVVFVGVSPIVLSYRFALPNKLFEALHSGRPVVVPRLPDIERTVGGLEAVYFCDPTDPTSIREALLEASAAPVDTHRLRTERMQLFSWEREASKLLQLYGGFLTD